MSDEYYGDENVENYDDEGYDMDGEEEEEQYIEGEYEHAEYNIAEFVYRDRERMGDVEDEFFELPIGTDTDKVNLDPDIRFKLDVKRYIQEDKITLELSERDIGTLKLVSNKLPFIQYKNPLLFMLGYYFLHRIYSEQNNSLKKKRLELIQQYIDREKYFTLFEVIKYSNYWRRILIKLV